MKAKLSICITACCVILASCALGGKQQAEKPHGEIEGLKVTNVKIPETNVLNLPSYYLSAYYRDTAEWLYAYNYRARALDCYDLRNRTVRQLLFKADGPSAVIRIHSLQVCSPDSIWIFDESQRALLLD